VGRTTLLDHRSASGASKDAPPQPGDDEKVVLYQSRKQIYPQLVSGKFRTIKWVVLFGTLGVYYLLPWLRWSRGANAPDQAVLADFAGGRFYFFGLEIWPQEVYYITGLLILAALGLFLITALFGRVWCGYTCPQTVWTDLFVVVERAFEGDRNARIKLDRAPWSFNKAWRKIGKHVVWLLVSFVTGGAFILYWHDALDLARTFFVGQAPMSAYVFAGLLTFTTYMLAGTMREQVCTYMCPWPRIQAAMIDKDTLAVTYRSDRGDPRGPHKKGEPWEGRGDCIDCRQCVVVCPMGIDIRKGLQLECIHCALCIDACDGVMKKIGRPTGLIAYDTDENVVARWMKKKAAHFSPFRPRILVYAAALVVTASAMTLGLLTRTDLELAVQKDRAVPYVRLSTGEIRNAYTLKLVNKLRDQRQLSLRIEGLPDGVLEVIGHEVTGDAAQVTAEPDGVDRYRLLVTAPASSVHAGGTPLRFVLESDDGKRAAVSALFTGPGG
jgi:cytochrome c oxidase accessory protein FixG